MYTVITLNNFTILGNNKSASLETYNYSTGVFTAGATNIPCRYEPYGREKKYIDDRVSFTMFCTKTEMKMRDRLTCSDGKIFTVIKYTEYDDLLGKHSEVYLRHTNSSLHENITRKVLTDVQTTYDEYWETFEDETSKNYESFDVSVLVEPMYLKKDQLQQELDPGVYENSLFVLIAEYPNVFTPQDRIECRGVEHRVTFVYEDLDKVLVGLEKTTAGNLET